MAGGGRRESICCCPNRKDGIDVTDKVAVGEWIDRFNRLPKRERDRILGPVPPLRPVQRRVFDL